jgi:hypothetical protein
MRWAVVVLSLQSFALNHAPPAGLYAPNPVLTCLLRNTCSGWGKLQSKYPAQAKPSVIIGQPEFFRMGTSKSVWFAQKFDKLMQVGASPDYLHLDMLFCAFGMHPLAIPWAEVEDMGIVSSCCGGMGCLKLDGGSAYISFNASAYQQCLIHKNSHGSGGMGGMQVQSFHPTPSPCGIIPCHPCRADAASQCGGSARRQARAEHHSARARRPANPSGRTKRRHRGDVIRCPSTSTGRGWCPAVDAKRDMHGINVALSVGLASCLAEAVGCTQGAGDAPLLKNDVTVRSGNPRAHESKKNGGL